LSMIFGNVAVAWLTAGVITPLFTPLNSIELFSKIIVSLFISGTFTFMSLQVVRNVSR
jgi:hypothetical protein